MDNVGNKRVWITITLIALLLCLTANQCDGGYSSLDEWMADDGGWEREWKSQLPLPPIEIQETPEALTQWCRDNPEICDVWEYVP